MKSVLLALCLAFFVPQLHANPGDTTWVTIYNLRKITQYGNYDTTAVLPSGKTYRKIRLHYILGRYACPAGTQYCGSWDYTTRVYARPAGADSVEIARVITPYATDWLSQNRSNDYTVDVTDYASILSGNLAMRYSYDGYSWGFTLTLKLEMIEGTPPMNALSVKNVYDGYYAYGKTADPIEGHLVAKSFQHTLAPKVFVKNIISGHGSDDDDCSEFCSKYYDLKINNAAVSRRQLWRSDCGRNNIYPQTGTWIYERANWCPGNVVEPIVHDVTSQITSNATFSVDIDLEPYTASNQGNAQAGYGIASQLISYSAPNYNLDVALEDIIAPSNNPNYARSNNVCSHPRVKIRNTGATAVTSVVFDYKLQGGPSYSYTWNGNLAFLQDTVVDLGPSTALFNGNASNRFQVSISKVNGVADQNSDNNVYNSTFVDVRSYPMPMVVYFSTNSSTSSIHSGFNESSWKIVDDAGNVVASRLNNANNKIYRDTINLPVGCYTFIASDDGCDGISWWANSSAGNGTLRFSSSSSALSYKTFNGDFGCELMERFTVGYVLGAKEEAKAVNTFQFFPNPASSTLNLLFDVAEYQDVSYTVTDVSGKQVMNGLFANISSTLYSINTSELGSGMYFVTCHFAKGDSATKKIVIQK